MNNHLTDFPIRPASVVPVGIHPAMIAQTLSVDADRLASALEAAGVEDINAVEVRPHVNAYTGLPGAEVLGVAGQNGFADDPDRYPHIVAMRLDPKRLRAVRVGLDHSQESFAKAIREAGTSLEIRTTAQRGPCRNGSRARWRCRGRRCDARWPL